MRLAVFLPNWIGDAVMATPALRALRQQFRQAEIVGVLRPYVQEVLDGTHLVDRFILHDPRGPNAERRGWQFIAALRRERFDVAVLMPNSLRSAWIARACGARRRVGFDRDARGWLLTDRIPPKPKTEPHPVLDEYLRLAEHLGCTDLSRDMVLATTPDDERRWSKFCKRLAIPTGERGIVTLNPGGAYGSAKHWPVESFAALARKLAEKQGKTVVVVCGPSEIPPAQQIARIADHPDVVTLAGERLTLGLTKAAIKNSELLITTDSGPRHFAAPFDVPVATLFGPTHIAWSETYFVRAVHLQHEVECGPCQQRTCPLEHLRCMRDLSVERVYAAALSLLNRYPAQLPAAG
jgi:heptosyltransferase-2